ncbi:MAG: Rrf2 family transcriptional regulator [Pseudomonadota bacterium]
MKRNSRLALALHTLGHMAADPKRVRTSSHIADHAGTNPVVVRRVLGKLRKAGLLSSEKGHAGGWRLSRAPEAITLADVYVALDERLVGTDDLDPGTCSMEQALHQRVACIVRDTEQTLLNRLAATTLADVQDARGCACASCSDAS